MDLTFSRFIWKSNMSFLDPLATQYESYKEKTQIAKLFFKIFFSLSNLHTRKITPRYTVYEVNIILLFETIH